MRAPRTPAYRRLRVDERRRQLIDAGARLFAEHAYEEISMRQIAAAAGVSKPLLYHYFPSKIDIFKAAAAEAAGQLRERIEPAGDRPPAEQLTVALDAYLAWIDEHASAWRQLMQSAASLPEAREFVDGFRTQTLELLVTGLTGDAPRSPALRAALSGWLGFLDAAILEWIASRELTRDQLRELLLTAFGGSLMAARQVDPGIELTLD